MAEPVWDVDSGGPKEPYIRWGPRSPRGERAVLGACSGISGMSQSYSVGGGSNASYRYQYCSKLLLLYILHIRVAEWIAQFD